MIKYVVFWDKNEIGRIYKDENTERYKYLPNPIEIERSSVPIAVLGNPQFTWGNMPEFFADRLLKDPGLNKNCNCTTDRLTIKDVKS